MNNVMEKLAYLKGVLEGVDLESERKDTKVIKNIVGLLEELSNAVVDMESNYSHLQRQVLEIEEDLGDLQVSVYLDECGDDCCCCDDCEYEDDDEPYYEVTCPVCNEIICLDEDDLGEGEIECPNCGEKLEFDMED